MGYLTARGYRCVAPDLQGYDGTTAPPEPSSYTVFHTIGDLIALVDALHVPQVPGRGFVPPFLVDSNSPTKLHMDRVCENVSQEWR
jgi:pimeloyl-ACP methyl ester carboxylesterase